MPGTPAGTDVVEHELRLAARPETVFAFFTDPEKMVRWMGAEATLDPRPGGVCRIVFRPLAPLLELLDQAAGGDAVPGPPGENVMLGAFAEIDPPRRVVFTWGYERELLAMPPQASEVEVTLTPDGDGTILRLVHRRLPAGAAAFHRAGWDHFLPRLAVAAAGDDPGHDPWEMPPGAA